MERLANDPLRIAVFASGEGSNLRYLYDRIESGEIAGAAISIVISNNSRSGAMKFSEAARLPAVHRSLQAAGGSEAELEQAIAETLRDYEAQLIVLAGYMKKLPASIVRTFENRILNIHPALLPSFGGAGMYGIGVHEAVLARGCKVSGATVHLVTEDYDAGPILLQECCQVYEDDRPEILGDRVRAIEHRLLARAIQLFVQGAVRVENGLASVLEALQGDRTAG